MQSAKDQEVSRQVDLGGEWTGRLGRRVSRRLAEDAPAGLTFVIAGIAALLSRLLQKTTVRITTASSTQTFVVDLAAPIQLLMNAAAIPGDSLEEATITDAAVWLNERQSHTAHASVPADLHTYPTVEVWEDHSQAGGPGDEPGDEEEDGSGSTWMITVSVPAASSTHRLPDYLVHLLESGMADPTQPVGTLPLATERKALAMYAEVNATEVEYPEKPVQTWIAEQAALQPSATAVVFHGAALSYRELQQKSDELAAVLVGMGASQGRPVALCIERSEQLAIVLLAALKAGSYYVPLDPGHPKQRLLDILGECDPAVVIVTSVTAHVLAGSTLPFFLLDGQARSNGYTEAMTRALDAGSLDHTAYTIYTSGTTGKPKGVVIPQRALVNVLAAAQRAPGLSRGQRWLSVATISFDMSVLDIFLPLVSGATLVIADEQDVADPAKLTSLMEQENIDCMQATPATWRMLIAHGWKAKPGLRMLSGGEALPRDLAEGLLRKGNANERDRELWNCYGPTETTIYSSFLRVQAGERIAIGPPTANTKFYLADAMGRLLPPDVPGELYIGGDGVATGYFERPELNGKKFIPDPWSVDKQARVFRTGDAARFRPDGTLDFYGRLDSQIKLRGYRIELGEIESVLRTHPFVADAAVVLREDLPGEPWLVAYIVTNTVTTGIAGEELAKALRLDASRTLPAYMLPARIVTLAALPLTGSGKVDKRALMELPRPEEARANGSSEEKPADTNEATLLRIFRDVLHAKQFGLEDSFFDYGGYSLLTVRLFARIAKELGTELPITALFEAPTVRKLAVLLRKGKSLPILVPIRTSGEDAPFFFVRSYLLYGLAGSLVPAAHPVYGLREGPRNGQLSNMTNQVTTCVEAITRVHPHGLVHLGGWCAAAPLTIEIARRLQSEGRSIGMVALFDAEAPGFVARPSGGSQRWSSMQATLTYHLSRLRRLPWRDGFSYLVERGTQHGLRIIEGLYLRHGSSMKKMQTVFPFLPSVFFHNRWTQSAIVEQQPLSPIDLEVSLFRALDVVTIPGSDEALGWNAIAKGGVEVLFVPGHHESMFHEPQLTVLRRHFAKAMAKTVRANMTAGIKTRAS